MLKLLKKIWKWIKKVWNKVDELADLYVPIAAGAVEAVKKAIESKKFSVIIAIIKTFTPKTTDAIIDRVVELLKEYIPKVSLQLQIIEAIADEEDPVKQIELIFQKIGEGVSNEQWQKFCTGLAQEILYVLADGKVTWAEAGMLIEYYYQNYVKESK
jgi:hypothetical protein